MNAFDVIEWLMKGAVLVFLIFCLPWIPLAHLVLKPYPHQLEPFEYFGPSWHPLPIAEYFFPTTEPGYPRAGWHFHYSDRGYEFVSIARVRQP